MKTITRSPRSQGFKAGLKTKKPLLKPIHCFKCLAWAKAHKSWTKKEWKNVVFSDESKYNLFESDRRDWCWKKARQVLAPYAVKPTVKFRGGNIIV